MRHIFTFVLIIAWACGRGPSSTATTRATDSNGSRVGAFIAPKPETPYDQSGGKPCVPTGSPQIPSRARGPRVPTVNHLHPVANWSLPDSSRLAFVWAPHAPRGDAFPVIGHGYVGVGTVNRCEALFAGQLLQYDNWRYTQLTSNDTMYVARLILTSGPSQGLEVLAFSHGEAARAAMFEFLASLTLDHQ